MNTVDQARATIRDSVMLAFAHDDKAALGWFHNYGSWLVGFTTALLAEKDARMREELLMYSEAAILESIVAVENEVDRI